MLLIKKRLFDIIKTVDSPIAHKIIQYPFMPTDVIVLTGLENARVVFDYLDQSTFKNLLSKIVAIPNCFDLSSEAGLVTFVTEKDSNNLLNSASSIYEKRICHYGSLFTNLCNTRLIKSKPARVFRKVFGDLFTESEYSEFGDKMNSAILAYLASSSGIKIVSGSEIYWAYNENNYYEDRGELSSSCMRYSWCKPFLDIYVDNPEQIRLIVALRDNLVIGRALLWKNKYYDRIYFNNEATRQNMVKFCNDNEFIPIYQSSIIESVQLANWQYPHYPYMDTFKNLSKTGVLYNQQKTNMALNNTDGEYDEYMFCPICQQKRWSRVLLAGVFCPACYSWNSTQNAYVLD